MNKIVKVNQDELLNLLSLEEQNNIEHRLTYFDSRFALDYLNFIALDGDKIIACLSLQTAYNRENSYHIEFVTVDHQYRNQQIATKLLETMFSFCRSVNKNIQAGKYSDDGQNYLKSKILLMAKEYNVKMYDHADP